MAWVSRWFGRRWPVHVFNVIGSLSLIAVFWSAPRVLLIWVAFISGGACLNALQVFLVRRDVERAGWLTELDERLF